MWVKSRSMEKEEKHVVKNSKAWAGSRERWDDETCCFWSRMDNDWAEKNFHFILWIADTFELVGVWRISDKSNSISIVGKSPSGCEIWKFMLRVVVVLSCVCFHGERRADNTQCEKESVGYWSVFESGACSSVMCVASRSIRTSCLSSWLCSIRSCQIWLRENNIKNLRALRERDLRTFKGFLIFPSSSLSHYFWTKNRKRTQKLTWTCKTCDGRKKFSFV